MRHGKKFNHLGRTADHRKAMLANLSISLIEHKRITTTVAKAKALKKYVEPLITRCKDDSTNSRRVVFRYLQNKEAQGDGAEMAFIELVDFDENMAKAPKAAAKRTRRAGKKAAPKAEAPAAEAPVAEAPKAEEAPAEEAKAE